MLVTAVASADLQAVRAALEQVGAREVGIVCPTQDRTIVLALVDKASTEAAAVVMRSDGWMTVTRPDGGAALEAWTRDTAPVCIGDDLTVVPVWSEHDRTALRGVVELGPGGFGNGHHRTTRMLVEELVKRLRSGAEVLDVGCGSGVLALCALQLGAGGSVAIDLKPEAVAATVANAALNGMSERLEAGVLRLDQLDRSFDVVLANIARAGIVELAPQLVAKVASGGWLAVSGIAPGQCDQIAEFLAPLVETARQVDGVWAMLVMQRS